MFYEFSWETYMGLLGVHEGSAEGKLEELGILTRL